MLKTAHQRLLEALAPTLTVRPKVTLDDLKIRTKDRQLVRFVLNPPQAQYVELLGGTELVQGTKGLSGNKRILLKARQQGFTTLIAALFFLDTINTPRTHSVIIANDRESTERIFQIIRRYYEQLPEGKKLRTRFENKGELYWPEIDSTMYVGTAGAKTYGRGSTVNNVHGSEVAFWDNPEDIIAGLMQAVPEDGNIFLESTANGMGNFYHKEWNNHESVFSKDFFGWFEHPDYVAPSLTIEELTETEVAKMKSYALSMEQISWYHKKTLELKKIKQEYPFNDKEAFIASDANFFDLESLDDYLTNCPHKVKETGYEEFVAPIKGRRYAIGADTSEGIDDVGDHDYSAMQVVDVETWEQVARFKERLEPFEFAQVLYRYGRHYNDALLVVERNNHGHAVLSELLHHTDYPKMARDIWGGVYYHLDYDAAKRRRIRRPGYPTQQQTKMLALDALGESIAAREITLNDKETIGELMSYQKLPGGKSGAAIGCHDDLVMSLALAMLLTKDKPKQLKKRSAQRKKGTIL